MLVLRGRVGGLLVPWLLLDEVRCLMLGDRGRSLMLDGGGDSWSRA